MKLREIVALNIRRIRLQKGMTQEQLAHQCGLVQTYVAKVENQAVNLTADQIDVFAAGLECGVENLILGEPQKKAGSVLCREKLDLVVELIEQLKKEL